MVPGFNHNVTRRGRAYHVQTEDLGTINPFVVTHLFTGGSVVATARTSYAELLGAGDLPDRVRDLMQEQHKQMLRNLVNGAYDTPVESGPAVARLDPGAASPVGAGASDGQRADRRRPESNRDATVELEADTSLDQVILAYLAGEFDRRG